MRAEASLGHCEIGAWAGLRIEQIACSRQQRSAPVATAKLSAFDEKVNGGQALDRRRWFEEAYQVAIPVHP
jgi:hypothetical protein